MTGPTHTTRTSVGRLLVVLWLGLLAGCQGPAAQQVADADIRQELTLRPHQTAVVSLPMTAGTGYDWTLDRSGVAPDAVVTVKRIESLMPTGTLGGVGEARWNVTGVAAGKAVLQFEYRRPWESGEPPAKTAAVSVHVTNLPIQGQHEASDLYTGASLTHDDDHHAQD